MKNVGKFIYMPVNMWHVKEQNSLYWKGRNYISFNLIIFFWLLSYLSHLNVCWKSYTQVDHDILKNCCKLIERTA